MLGVAVPGGGGGGGAGTPFCGAGPGGVSGCWEREIAVFFSICGTSSTNGVSRDAGNLLSVCVAQPLTTKPAPNAAHTPNNRPHHVMARPRRNSWEKPQDRPILRAAGLYRAFGETQDVFEQRIQLRRLVLVPVQPE